MKRKIYLNEYNIEVDNSVFLPYSTGLLQAYAQQFDKINDAYEFKPIIFRKDTVENIVAQYDNPDVVGFSTVIWNYELSLAVAKALKEKFPNCLIVFGGPCVERNNEVFVKYPYIDMTVYGEGEKAFETILRYRLLKYKLHHDIFWNFGLEPSLDIFPSPYISGVYDKILEENPDIDFKALVECNRNCPFGCDYCFWGQPELDKKIKFHSPRYIEDEAQWIAKHKIDYVFCTDANFGMFKRDVETAKTYSITKKHYGYPEKFRVCYGKNAASTIFDTASILNEANMDKLITLSVQSTNPETLKAVNRKNIRHTTFYKLQKRYLKNNISTYTEFILGLPLETKQSFYDGLEQTIRTIKHNQIFVYPCQVLPNTKLASKAYREKYGLITRKVPMKVPHTDVVNKEWVQEWDEIVIGTDTMSINDWIECTVMSWVVQLIHSLKIGYDIVTYLQSEYNFKYMKIYTWLIHSNIDIIRKFWLIAESVTFGHHWSQFSKIFGNIYYEPEELAYLNILYNTDNFYDQLLKVVVKTIQTTRQTSLIGDPYIYDIVQKQKKKLPNTDNITDWEKFAIDTVIRGGKDN